MDIIELEGEDQRLYSLVAHLVMNNEILKYNLDYPYRTSVGYRWFVATEDSTTVGFIPVKFREGKAIINNYYVAGDDSKVFAALLQKTKNALMPDFSLEAVVQTRHSRFFEIGGFSVVHYWKRFVKMIAYKDERECV